MKDDHDIETRLRRFRPAAPPLALRERVLGSANEPRRMALWLEVAAAAALLAIGLTLNQLTARLDRHIDAVVADAQKVIQP